MIVCIVLFNDVLDKYCAIRTNLCQLWWTVQAVGLSSSAVCSHTDPYCPLISLHVSVSKNRLILFLLQRFCFIVHIYVFVTRCINVFFMYIHLCGIFCEPPLTETIKYIFPSSHSCISYKQLILFRADRKLQPIQSRNPETKYTFNLRWAHLLLLLLFFFFLSYQCNSICSVKVWCKSQTHNKCICIHQSPSFYSPQSLFQLSGLFWFYNRFLRHIPWIWPFRQIWQSN